MLITITVRRMRKGSGAGKGKNYASVTRYIESRNIVDIIPSVCDKDGITTDGLVNSEVWVKGQVGAGEYGGLVKFWCTELAATIFALDTDVS